MKESSYKSYDDLPLFLNAATVAKALGGVSLIRLRADARAGFPGAEDRQQDGGAKRTVHLLGG